MSLGGSVQFARGNCFANAALAVLPGQALNKRVADGLRKLCLDLPSGENFGWGLCGKYLRQVLGEMEGVELVEEVSGGECAVVYPLNGFTLEPHDSHGGGKRGWLNVGYVFFEHILHPDAGANAARSDLVLAGSTWCVERLREAGVEGAELLIQGVDGELFYPVDAAGSGGEFVVFSGGKFELRKGQDLVLRAFAQLQQRCPEMVLLTAWENHWPQTMESMRRSPYISYELAQGSWREQLSCLCAKNGVDPARVRVCPMVPHHKMRGVMARSHVGVFPNRCEGGTNLVLMEYMACGRPVIAGFSSGHRDVVTPECGVVLEKLKPFEYVLEDGTVAGYWEEPELDDLVEAMAWAYKHRGEMAARGTAAGERMKPFSWKAMGERLVELMERRGWR